MHVSSFCMSNLFMNGKDFDWISQVYVYWDDFNWSWKKKIPSFMVNRFLRYVV